MAANKKIKYYNLSNQYVLRTHTLSMASVTDLTVEKIREYCSKPFVSEAIFLASPVLHREMLKYINGYEVKDESKLINSLLKYLLRMGNRCTPFGLFAGYNIGNIGDETSIELGSENEYERHTNLDMSYLCSVSQKFESLEEVRKGLKYYPNSSAYEVGNELRYIEFKYKGTNKSHYTMAIDNSEYVAIILEKSKNGASIEELAKLIVEPEITLDDAVSFINQLIDSQILVSSISPSVTGTDYLNFLRKNVPQEQIRAQLGNVYELLAELDSKKNSKNNLRYYEHLCGLLDKFEISYNKKHLIQTNMRVATSNNTLSHKIGNDIEKAVVILNKLTPYRGDGNLENFKRRFYNKFENEHIPLSLALDVETGVGYGTLSEQDYDISPLLSGLSLNASNQSNELDLKWTNTDEFLHKKLLSQSESQAFEISITDSELDGFKENWDNLSPSFNVLASMLDNSENPDILIKFAGGPSAIYMLGRFSQTDHQLETSLKEITKEEAAQNDVILAEVAHLPESRMGNILNRSHLREYEIPYMAKSTLPLDKQIPISDILVSMRNNRIVLLSKKHNKEIWPRLSSAHNYSNNSLPIYNFLCDIQTQNKRYDIDFSWGNATRGRSFLPRLRYKNIILSPAQWIVNQADIKEMVASQSISNFRKKRKVPQKFLLKDFDNELLIDLDHELSVKMFISAIKNKSQITLVEQLFDEKNSLINKEGEAYTNEFLFSLIKNNENI